jgi:hypothetical protein
VACESAAAISTMGQRVYVELTFCGCTDWRRPNRGVVPVKKTIKDARRATTEFSRRDCVSCPFRGVFALYHDSFAVVCVHLARWLRSVVLKTSKTAGCRRSGVCPLSRECFSHYYLGCLSSYIPIGQYKYYQIDALRRSSSHWTSRGLMDQIRCVSDMGFCDDSGSIRL